MVYDFNVSLSVDVLGWRISNTIKEKKTWEYPAGPLPDLTMLFD